MSRTRHGIWDDRVLTITCPTCDAKPETWCKTSSGRWASVLHNSRWLAYWAARRQEIEANR